MPTACTGITAAGAHPKAQDESGARPQPSRQAVWKKWILAQEGDEQVLSVEELPDEHVARGYGRGLGQVGAAGARQQQAAHQRMGPHCCPSAPDHLLPSPVLGNATSSSPDPSFSFHVLLQSSPLNPLASCCGCFRHDHLRS